MGAMSIHSDTRQVIQVCSCELQAAVLALSALDACSSRKTKSAGELSVKD